MLAFRTSLARFREVVDKGGEDPASLEKFIGELGEPSAKGVRGELACHRSNP
jgi:hypothetical protein